MNVKASKVATPSAAQAAATPGRRRWPLNIAVVGIALLMLLLVAWPFLSHPGRLAPTRDPAWYTLRTSVLLHDDPSILFEKAGPFGMFSGGYRVTTPLAGALLARIAGIDPTYFTALLAVALPVLASLALAAFALRHRKDPIAYLLTLVAAVPLFLTVPYIGYMDNLLGVFLLAVALSFLDGARTSWGARSALAVLLFLATLTHPPATALFVLALGAGSGLRLIAYRFSLSRILDREGPPLASIAVGTVLALAFWKAGLWGGRTGLSDVVLTQPYTQAFFRGRLQVWVRSLHPRVVVPLAVLAFGWVGIQVFRRRPLDRHAEMSVLWLIPIAGVFGFLLGKTYPYYRFINLTLALMLLAGFGAWVLTRVFGVVGARIRDRWGILQGAGVAIAFLAIGFSFVRPGLRLWERQSPWTSASARVTFAGVRAYAANAPGHPIVIVLHPNPRSMRAWGLAKQASNLSLAGMAGDQVDRTFFYVGEPGDFLARRPTATGYPMFDRLSRGFLADMDAGLRRYSAQPIAFFVHLLNASGSRPPARSTLPVGPGEALFQGPGLAAQSTSASAAARRAEQAMDRAIGPQSLLGDPANILRALGGIAILLIPGIVAMRWFELSDFPTRMALIPALSIAMTLMAGILVVAVRRTALGAAEAWATLGLATAAAIVLSLLARRDRRAARSDASPQSSKPFSSSFG
jgi:hypothetical protein